ncbi:MAG: VanW family protein [Candidatus Andersenbacteria bacterium]
MKKLILLGVGIVVAVLLPVMTHASNVLLNEVTVTPERAQQIKSQSFTLTHKGQRWTASPAEVRKWFKTRVGLDGQVLLQLRPGAIYDYLNVHISPKVNNIGENSRFAYVGGNLHLLHGGRKGQIVDGIKTSLAIRSALAKGIATAPVSMKEYRPSVFSAEDFRKLKFPDLLSRGETNFAGSPANRRHNIAVATARYNGLVIMPGEEFSFNGYLGSVDAANGYLPELVIKENVTTPEYGGGICQVSTTVFRAAMQAGLEITARKNHSYPVAYYGTPGYDATIYSPAPDFKFKNDTANPVYLTTQVSGTRVIFEVWGTSDGRQVTVNGPFVTERRPDGSLTAAVAQIVKKNGKSIREKNFVSHYQSPDKFPTVRAANGE